MTVNLITLRSSRALKLTESQRIESDRLFTLYCSRDRHRYRMTSTLKASLRAAANRVAIHGNPPNRNQRLAYRMHKKRRAKLAAIATYGNPLLPYSH